MRAWLLDQPGPIETRPMRLVDVGVPVPGVGEVRVRVAANALCRTDLHVVEGELAPRRRPVTPGHQIAGVVEAVGEGAVRFQIGDRVGVPWLRGTDGTCRFCLSGRENLCEAASFTGWDADGGYAEYAVASETYIYPLPDGFSDVQAAPLLCAGIIGYRALETARLGSGGRLGLYGFGGSAHVTIQVARARGLEVAVFTRGAAHQRLALELGAACAVALRAGEAGGAAPFELDAAIIFAPAGGLVPVALAAVGKGGVVVCAGIHMSDVPAFEYGLLYGERTLTSVANNTRADGEAFLREAAAIPVRMHVETFPLEDAQEALLALKRGGIEGAGVVVV